MKMNKYDTLVEAHKALLDKGYNRGYKLIEEDRLECIETGKIYTPDEMVIMEYHRFEGESDPGDMSIIVGIRSSDGEKGIMSSAYGTYADRKLLDFISKLKIRGDAQKV